MGFHNFFPLTSNVEGAGHFVNVTFRQSDILSSHKNYFLMRVKATQGSVNQVTLGMVRLG